MKTYQVKVIGLTPLLMHYDNIDWADAMSAWQHDPMNKGKSKAGDDRTPPWRWLGSVYHNGEYVCIPTDNLARALTLGATQISMNGKKTYKEASQQSIAFPEDNWILQLGPKGGSIRVADLNALKDNSFSFSDHLKMVADLGFLLSVKRARVDQSKHIRVRPRFDDWTATGRVLVDDDIVSLDVLREIWKQAGKKGICDWRPSAPKSPGPWGMFEAEIKEL